MADSLKKFTDENWNSEVLESDMPVLVDFWAQWCSPCRRLKPLIEKLADEYQGRVKVGAVDTDVNQNTAVEMKITSIPTVVLFHHGKEVDRLVGGRGENEYKESLAKVGIA